MIYLCNLPDCYSLTPEGTFRAVEPTDAAVAAAIIPGCEDLSAISSTRTTGSARELRYDEFAERDRPLNPLGSQFAGRPIFGTIVVMPLVAS